MYPFHYREPGLCEDTTSCGRDHTIYSPAPWDDEAEVNAILDNIEKYGTMSGK